MKYRDGTVPSRKKYRDGTVPSHKKHCYGTVPSYDHYLMSETVHYLYNLSKRIKERI